jgi:hypothetical protein
VSRLRNPPHLSFQFAGMAGSAGAELPLSNQFIARSTAGLVSGTRSESACRCRTAPAGHQATRHASGSPSSAQGERLPSSDAGAVHAQVLGRALGRPLAGTRHGRSRPAWGCRAAAARGVRRRRVGSTRADEATHDGLRPERPTNIGVLSRAEHDPLNIGRSRASGCLELGGGRRRRQGRQPADQQDEGDRRYAHTVEASARKPSRWASGSGEARRARTLRGAR